MGDAGGGAGSDAFTFVDAHHHLWDLGAHRYGWLDGDGLPGTTAWIGPYAAIRRTYLVDDFLDDAAACGLVGSVHVEALWGDEDGARETRWLQSLADERGFPSGIVAFVDLRAADVEARLEEHLACAGMRGVRMAEMGGLVADPAFRRGFACLARRGLSYDLNITWQEVPAAIDLARAFPDTTILVGNMANPASLDAATLADWRPALRQLAEAPNVAVKLSGLGMADHAWTVERIRPWLLEAVDAFGPRRAMFGSNWPVDSLYGTYPELVAAYREVLAGLSAGERDAIFRATASRLYRLA